ncbi:glycosyltransferase family 2 protein [Ornithinicoccus hortensis]|uniref:Glycosyl transferase family 2 n=1 Tax=Ornithinicoccus hortensis TaxID=82346 RepID=A0A542YLJ7_9MICO|nr:glycosyltransferase family 2 protein [Ornithinicoccus hortensis]TQL48970.1 glycosyl transferase family 2 [Ornithinicoccus hortensis]
MPRLSVILPARNAEGTLRRAVLSTLRSLPKDAEIVILNDGSEDRTGEVATQFRDPRVRVLHSAGSGGLGNALNYLLKNTDSQFVARMDADDVSMPWRFHIASLSKDSPYDFVFCPVVDFERRTIRPGVPSPIRPAAFPFHLLLGNPVCHPSMFARRVALDRLGGYRQVEAEDYDLWLRAAEAEFGMRRLAPYVVAKREHGGQVTASPEYYLASRQNPLVGEAFRRLSAQRLGRPFPRLVELAYVDEQTRKQTVEDFASAFSAAISRLTSVERFQLGVKMQRRLRLVVQEVSS